MKPQELAQRAQQLRESRGMNQTDIAELTGYSTSSISKAENFREGDGMTGVRISIIEELTGDTIEGPLYRVAD